MDKNKKGYVFISYSSKNQQMADSVRQLFIDEGINCWMAPYDIPAGSKYASVINDALEDCACFVLLLTNASQESQFVQREVERAISYNKAVIPVQLEDITLNSEFKFYIGNSQIVDVSSIDRNSGEIKKVIDGIQNYLDTEKNMTVREPDYFFKLSMHTDHNDGSLFVYSPECNSPDDIVKIVITDEMWKHFVHCCKKLIMSVLPGVEYDNISITGKKELGEYQCAPNNGYHNEEQYRLDFDVAFLPGNDCEKYDSAHFELGNSFEVHLWNHGNYPFYNADGKTALDDYGIDENQLIQAAEEMIHFATRKDKIKISQKFRQGDGKGGYILDYIVQE